MKGFIVILGAIGLITLLVIIAGGATESVKNTDVSFPEPTNYVVDDAGALKPETVTSLNASLKAYDHNSQIAVLVVKTTAPLEYTDYAWKVFEKWGVGDKEKNNGVLLLLVTEDRKVRIEVGKGAEGNITDAEAGRILDEKMIPFLKNSDWDNAVVAGVEEIKNKLSQ